MPVSRGSYRTRASFSIPGPRHSSLSTPPQKLGVVGLGSEADREEKPFGVPPSGGQDSSYPLSSSSGSEDSDPRKRGTGTPNAKDRVWEPTPNGYSRSKRPRPRSPAAQGSTPNFWGGVLRMKLTRNYRGHKELGEVPASYPCRSRGGTTLSLGWVWGTVMSDKRANPFFLLYGVDIYWKSG